MCFTPVFSISSKEKKLVSLCHQYLLPEKVTKSKMKVILRRYPVYILFLSHSSMEFQFPPMKVMSEIKHMTERECNYEGKKTEFIQSIFTCREKKNGLNRKFGLCCDSFFLLIYELPRRIPCIHHRLQLQE
jgi:hypothetical protein